MSAVLSAPLLEASTDDLSEAIADYLEREKSAEIRHEFYYGEVTEMPGGMFEHGNIGVDFLITLAFLLRSIGSNCELYSPDQKVFIAPGVFYYPDLSATCESPQIDFEEALRNPTLVVEVLSESTRTKDKTQKKNEYQKLTSLQHYVLVEQNTPRIENYVRNAATGLWQVAPMVIEGLDAELPLAALNVSVPLAAIYRRASFVD